MKQHRLICAALALVLGICLVQPAAAVSYLPDVTAQMTEADYWISGQTDAREVLLDETEIAALNRDIELAAGTVVTDLRQVADTFDGIARNKAILSSAASDAEYYLGWTYGADGQKADKAYYQQMIDNCADPRASFCMTTRFGVAVNRTVLQVFPSDRAILDDPADPDFDYQALSALRVNEPLVLYTTSADGNYYLARSSSCSGWVKAADVAVCRNKAEWLSAWDLPSEQLLIICENKVYTENSNYAPAVSERLLTMGTALERVPESEASGLIENRSAYHNYAVYLPVRKADGSYAKEKALIPQTASVSEGYLPMTRENILSLALDCLGAAYGWGGMLNAEDCSGFARTVYACFGLNLARNDTWQWNMPVEKSDMSEMSAEEKLLVLDRLPGGALLRFSGHVMLYLGKSGGKYYVISAASRIRNPDDSGALRTRVVAINTLDLKRANGQTWLEALSGAYVPFYPSSTEETHAFRSTQWYHDPVAYCLKNGLMSPRAGGVFGLNEAATRAELATALWVYAGKPESEADIGFADVAEDSSYRKAVAWAAENGLMIGTGECFLPEAALSREQCAAVLYRYALSLDGTAGGEAAALKQFRDAFRISSYAKDAMAWACTTGLLTGTAKGRLSPTAATSRVQLAAILSRLDAALTPAAEPGESTT